MSIKTAYERRLTEIQEKQAKEQQAREELAREADSRAIRLEQAIQKDADFLRENGVAVQRNEERVRLIHDKFEIVCTCSRDSILLARGYRVKPGSVDVQVESNQTVGDVPNAENLIGRWLVDLLNRG